MFVLAGASVGAAIMSEARGLFDGLTKIVETMESESCAWDEAVARLREPPSNVVNLADYWAAREAEDK
jgi:hypothetical protein